MMKIVTAVFDVMPNDVAGRFVRAALLVLIATAAAAAAAPVHAQAPDSAGVRSAVLDYLEGFYEGDTTRIARSVAPNVFKYGFARSDGAYVGMQMSFPDGFMNFVRGVAAGRSRPPADAPRRIEILDVLDQTAAAKLTAWWGTDYLLLARIDGRWMITHVLWQSPPVK